jgi:hypothetical protein
MTEGLTGQRYVGVAVVALLLIVTGVALRSYFAAPPSAEADPFADLEAEFGPAAVVLGEQADGPELGPPPAMLPVEFAAEGPFLTSPSESGAPAEPSTMPAQFTVGQWASPPEAMSAPVWFEGTIEPVDDVPVIPWEVRQAVGPERFRR